MLSCQTRQNSTTKARHHTDDDVGPYRERIPESCSKKCRLVRGASQGRLPTRHIVVAALYPNPAVRLRKRSTLVSLPDPPRWVMRHSGHGGHVVAGAGEMLGEPCRVGPDS